MIRALEIKHVQLCREEGGMFIVTVAEHKNITRTHKGANLVLDQSTMFLLKTYITHIRPLVVNFQSEQYVFLTMSGCQIGTGTVSQALTSFLVTKGPEQVSLPRVCQNWVRHTAVTVVSIILC